MNFRSLSLPAFALFAALVLAACGNSSTTCNASSCTSGCCDASGVCQSSGASTCGIGGATCAVCSGSASCKLGKCEGGAGGGGGGSGVGGGTAGGSGVGGGTAGGAGGAGGGEVDAGAGAYPPPPYGVSVNRVIENFTFPGYFSAGSGVKINTLAKTDALDLQTIRNAVDANGKRFRFLLLDISAGWCPPCNQEAQDIGLQGTKSAQIANWLGRGGIFMTVLVEGYDESTHNPPVPADIETWANQHATQSSLAIDPTQSLITQGINPSAFPTNLVIDLRTMKIVGAWYGLDTTYQKWEAALNGP